MTYMTSANKFAAMFLAGFLCQQAAAQDPDSGLGDIDIPIPQSALCFGFSDITDLRALAICDALNIDQNVRARELAEQWIREDPGSPAAQFAFAEVLYSVEGNLPRALFHLNRAEALTNYSTLEEAFSSGNVQWHYLTLSQLSYVHQLMGDQLASLAYLDKIYEFYGQEVESFRGWPLIKLKQYEAARESANRVLDSSDDQRQRARAWNTLCAVELASLQPIESMAVCDRAVSEDENLAQQDDFGDTVYLSNASEVALSLLQFDRAEEYLDRATRYLNPGSVADPWIYKLYLTMNQSRFDEARTALDRMLVWRETQEPIINVMNRAEHAMVSASFLLLAGYADDAAKLSASALNQPDRNGSYSADAEQKDAVAALIYMMALRARYQIELEKLATEPLPARGLGRMRLLALQIDAWRAERRAAALFANDETLLNRLRPYAPLDVHIPEWVEPEMVRFIGTGIIEQQLQQALDLGAFQLNQGYYYSYRTEIAALENRHAAVITSGELAIQQLPAEEVMLRARVAARLAQAYWQQGDIAASLNYYRQALRDDPSLIRRLGTSIPVSVVTDNSTTGNAIADTLARSPRFRPDNSGLVLSINSTPELSACINDRNSQAISCYTMPPAESGSSTETVRHFNQEFHRHVFGLGYDISQAQRSILMGSSVILSSQNNPSLQETRNRVISR